MKTQSTTIAFFRFSPLFSPRSFFFLFFFLPLYCDFGASRLKKPAFWRLFTQMTANFVRLVFKKSVWYMLLNISIAWTNGLVTKLYSTVNIAVSSLLPKWSISKLINRCTRYIKMPHLHQLNMLQKNKENWKIGFSHKIQMKFKMFCNLHYNGTPI